MNGTDVVHAVLRYSHVVAGIVGLLVFWIPVCAKKGSKLHIRCGRVFVWCGYYVAATAAVSCTWGLLSPTGFAGTKRALSVEETAALAENLRFLFAILGTLMTWLLSALVMGMYAVRSRLKSDVGAGRVRLACTLSALASAALLVFGLVHLPPPGAAILRWLRNS